MESVHDIAQMARDQMPPGSSFGTEDAALILRHRELLLSLEAGFVQGFYDTLFAHGATTAVFTEGERPMREVTFSNWWQRTCNGPLDDDYFAWMAMVGLVHVVRDVSNPMMLAMAGYVADYFAQAIRRSDLSAEEVDALTEAIHRLMVTVSAIITFGYDQSVEGALFEVAGMPHALLRRLRDQQVASALDTARDQLHR